MKVLQLGLGRRGRNVLRNLVRLRLEGFVEEIFVHDPVTELVQEAKRRYRVVKHGDPEGDYDAVFIITPPGTHFDLAKSYMDRGIACFIEKPPVLSLEQLEELLKTGSKASADMLLRYLPIVERLKELKPKYLEASRSSVPSRSVDVSVIRDIMIHDLDLAFFLYGPREVLSASKIYDLEGFPSPSAAEVKLEGFSFKAFWTPRGFRLRERLIVDEEFEAYRINTSKNEIERLSDGHKEVFSGEEPLYLSIKDFIEYVLESKKPRNELSSLRYTIGALEDIEKRLSGERELDKNRSKA